MANKKYTRREAHQSRKWAALQRRLAQYDAHVKRYERFMVAQNEYAERTGPLWADLVFKPSPLFARLMGKS